MDSRKLVGRNIRRIRREKGWSQEKLAFESGVHRTYINLHKRSRTGRQKPHGPGSRPNRRRSRGVACRLVWREVELPGCPPGGTTFTFRNSQIGIHRITSARAGLARSGGWGDREAMVGPGSCAVGRPRREGLRLEPKAEAGLARRREIRSRPGYPVKSRCSAPSFPSRRSGWAPVLWARRSP